MVIRLGCAAAVQHWSSYRIHVPAATRAVTGALNLAQLASFRILRK